MWNQKQSSMKNGYYTNFQICYIIVGHCMNNFPQTKKIRTSHILFRYFKPFGSLKIANKTINNISRLLTNLKDEIIVSVPF